MILFYIIDTFISIADTIVDALIGYIPDRSLFLETVCGFFIMIDTIIKWFNISLGTEVLITTYLCGLFIFSYNIVLSFLIGLDLLKFIYYALVYLQYQIMY